MNCYRIAESSGIKIHSKYIINCDDIDGMRTNARKEPPYRRVRIESRFEEMAWKVLFEAGIPFDHAAENEYVVTSGQCHLLNRSKVPYQKLD